MQASGFQKIDSQENTIQELLQEIITNGIRADYMANIESHDLVGMPEYCHFTSPIRRLSDCVCHYLLKYIYFKHKHSNIPFSEQELDQLATRCMKMTRFEKKNQYLDIKFRLLQVMANMIFAANDQSSETTNRRLRLALEQLHGQQLSDFENEDTDSLEEPDELVD